ncbi:MAG TPA: Eco57I restriction-modification methylase domain-containing protein [Rectinemataceae bacterium]|nr:Eco57I restriction-modification methylase domain-containing protein [Rectinemataceae bacterium]
MIYGKRKSGGEHGTVYTKPGVVNFMLDLAGLKTEEDFLNKKTLDPSVGEGAFALGLVERILAATSDPMRVAKALSNITVVELDPVKIDTFTANLQAAFDSAAPELREFWHEISVIRGDYLASDTGHFDVVIGNPPYVRYDKLPPNKAELYRALFPCFKARSDLYIAFIEKAVKSLNPGGVLAYICADRWLTNGYGLTLRKLIARNFHLSDVIRISGFSPFAEQVVAYPAIFAVRRETPGATNYLAATKLEDLDSSVLSKDSVESKLDESGELRLREDLPNCLTIEEQGFTIGIGVATGADDIFIVRKSEVQIEDSILVPLLTREDVDGDRIVWKDRYVINPFAGDSPRLVDLDELPLLSRYLRKHRAELERRYVAKRNPEHWYKTIDRIYPSLVHAPKLLIPDISSKHAIVLDEGEHYPHHNFYYVAGKGLKELAALRGLLSTEFARRQVAEKGILMNSGSLRWQAQTLRKLKLPDIRAMSESEKDEIIAAYGAKDFVRIEKITNLHVA